MASFGPGAAGAASAREDAAQATLTVSAFVCERDPGNVLMRDGQYRPDDCTARAGVRVALLSAEGQLIGSCETGIDGSCSINKEPDVIAVLQVEPESIPIGYVAQANLTVIRPKQTMGTVVLMREDGNEWRPDAVGLTVHSRVCPAGYAGSDWFNDCHGSAPAIPHAVALSGPTIRGAWTDLEGNASFDRLPAGYWWLVPALSQDIADLFTFCSRTSEPGVEFPASLTRHWEPGFTSFTIQLELTPGDNILCDLYAIPTAPSIDTAQVTFHIRNCSERLSVEEVYERCHGNGSSNWFGIYEVGVGEIYLEGYLDDNGNVTLHLP
ncbi:MAG: hypothetical protein IT336_14590, partial [Thermomicrobiales bacterium]|nr:hypothetical protein [Thermomicrobiales bacterium]